jgi:hypothetical protein
MLDFGGNFSKSRLILHELGLMKGDSEPVALLAAR